MFCPKCASQNLEGASFCRTCGANISLIPQALTGEMEQPPAEDEGGMCSPRRSGQPLTLERAFKSMFTGIAFLIIAIALARSIGAGWWFWMLIPAFSLMGRGVAQYIRVKDKEKRTPMMAPRIQPALPRPTGELRPPVASVTEGTTRHLGVEAPTRHFETHEPK